jgi:5-methylcytosine-specific restriction endonuclease McrA
MTRSRGRATKRWLTQVVHIQNMDIPSAANLVLLSKEYFSADKSIYSDWRMCHIRKKWMKQQMKTPDALGGLTCAICGKQGLKPGVTDVTQLATLDHIVEISHGGVWNDPSNFQVACHGCNAKKSETPKEVYA